MGTIAYVTTPGGEELAILPRRELDELREAVDHAQSVAAYRGGLVPGLSADETRSYVEAPSPLSFWRKYRAHTQASLARAVGVTQHYLSDIENGKRGGDVQLWLRLSRALDIPIESLIDEEE